MKTVCRAFVLILTVSLFAGAQSFEIRQAGDYVLKTNDSPDTARRLASLDANLKALGAAGAALVALPSVKSLGLTPLELAAYLAGTMELPEPENSSAGAVFRSEISFQLDSADAVRKLDDIRGDSEVSRDLMETAQRIRQLRDKLTADNRAVGTAIGSGVPKALQAREQTLAKLQANQWLAQARAALTHQETGTTSAPVTTEEGRHRARQLVDRVMTLDASNVDGQRVMGDVLLAADDPAGAEREFRIVLREKPDSAFDHNKLGNALLSQGKTADAATEFKEAIRLNPDDFVSHSDLGLILRQQRDPDATVEFREALRINPRYVDGYNNLGIDFASQGRTPEALAEFQEMIRLRPNSVLGHFNAATALADLEKDEESTTELRETVRLNPNHYNAHYNLGEMLRLTGKLEESAKEFREYVNRAPDTPRTQRNKERANSLIKAFEEP